jgi:REP element-mobilizing transposase RayT
MKNDRQNRRSIRLKNYDYSQAGAYFVTVCTQNHICLFGDIVEGEMVLNDLGRVVQEEWIKTEQLRPNVCCGKFVVMPNHFHGILIINESRSDGRGALRTGVLRTGVLQYAPTEFKSPSQTIGAIVRGFKSAVTKKINYIRQTPGQKCWQRNYYEHIIRNDDDYQRINEYIENNPLKWTLDVLNPANGANKWKK